MRSLILSEFKDSLNEAVNGFLDTIYQDAAENIYDLGIFSKDVQFLQSSIEKAKNPILLRTNVSHFINQNLAGFRGFLPWCNECKLKSRIKIVLSEDRYSVLALANAYLLEMDTFIFEIKGLLSERDATINEKQVEIERLKKGFEEQKSKGKEEASFSQNSTTATVNSQKTNNPSEDEIFRQKEYDKLVVKISKLEADIQKQELEKDEIKVKYQAALVEIERQKDRNTELEQRVVQQPLIQNPPEPSALSSKLPQRLAASGVFRRF